MDNTQAEATATPRLNFGAPPPDHHTEAAVHTEETQVENEIPETEGAETAPAVHEAEEVSEQVSEDVSDHSPDEPSPEELAALAEQNAQFVSEETLTTPSSGSGEVEEPGEPELPETYTELPEEEVPVMDSAPEAEELVEDRVLTDDELGLPVNFETTADEQASLNQEAQEREDEGNLSEASDGETSASGTQESVDTEASGSQSTLADEPISASEPQGELEVPIDIEVEEAAQDGPTVEELKAEQERIAAQITAKETAEKTNVLTQVKNVLEMYKISTEELVEFLGGLKLKRKGVKAKIKFKDPKTGATWSGRGKTPNWMKGQDPEKFRVLDTASEG